MSQAGNQKQREILAFIERFQEENGYAPSVREIGSAVGLSSTSTVHSHLQKLQEQGLIARERYKSRATAAPREEPKLVEPALGKGGPLPENSFLLNHEVCSIPVVGSVAAGVPILAEENIEDAIPLPTEFLRGDANEHFILNVRGDSMVDAGILDGDYLVVRSQSTARNGEIVVAMIDGEATVKRFYRERDCVRLQPENDLYKPIIRRDVQVLGLVVSLLRRM